MSTLKIEHISHLDNGTPDLSIDSSGHLNIVNGNLQMGGVTMLDTNVGAPLPLSGGTLTGNLIIDPSAAGAAVLGLERTGAANQWKIAQGHTATDYLEILEGSSTRLTIKNGGYVGIGTTSPDTLLHLSQGSTNGAGGGDAGITMTNKYDDPDNSWAIKPQRTGVSNTGLEIRDVTDSRSVMSFDGAGNVGIGVFTPDYALDVRGGNSTSNGARIKTGDNGYDGLIVSNSSILKCYPAAGQSVSLQAYNSVGSTKTGVKVTGSDTPDGDISTKLESVTELLGHNVYDNGNYGTSSDQYVDLEDWSPADFRILEIFGTANPNSGGSGAYADPVHMYVYNGSGWNGAEVTYYVYGKSVAPLARDMFGSGSGSSGNVAEVWWYNSSTTAQQDAATHGTASGYHLRLKFPNTNTNTTMISLKVIKRA